MSMMRCAKKLYSPLYAQVLIANGLFLCFKNPNPPRLRLPPFFKGG